MGCSKSSSKREVYSNTSYLKKQETSQRNYSTLDPEENIESKLLHIGLGTEFLDLTLKAKATKAKINK